MISLAGQSTAPALVCGLPLPVRSPPAPEEIRGCGDDDHQDRRPDERREDFDYPLSSAERPPQAAQARVPDAVAEEPRAQRHTLQAGRHGDQGADAGDQVSDQDRLSSVTLEYRARPFDI